MMPAAADLTYANAPPRYPAHLVASRRLPEGSSIVIRPIRPEDEAIEWAFIRGLSQDSAYNRLLSARKLTPEEIRQLTRIDYEREMAFIAVAVDAGIERVLGDARYVRDADGRGAEFAIVVADAWQRRGAGTLLLNALLAHARAAGIERLHGITLATNEVMHGLARKLGFVRKLDPQDASVRQLEKALSAVVLPVTVLAGHSNLLGAANDEGFAPCDPPLSPEPGADWKEKTG